MLGISSLSFIALPSHAQTDEDVEITTTDDWDYEYDWDYDWNTDYTTDLEDTEALTIAGLVFGGIFAVIAAVFGIAMYVYSGLTLMTIAKKLNQPNGWFAWVPILNVILLFKMGDQNPWLLLLALIPGIGAFIVGILSIIALMNICEKRGYDKLLGLLALVPLANIILMGMLAWGKKE
jgi:hypothetical protein